MIPTNARVKKLDSIVGAILRASSASWAPSNKAAKRLDALQFRMICWMSRTRKRLEETPEMHDVRRARLIRDVPRTQWSRIHAVACLSWWSHLQRHQSDWPAVLTTAQGCDWVSQNRRVWDSPSSRSSKTNTRSARVRVIWWDQKGWTQTFSPEGSRDPKRFWELAGLLLREVKARVLEPPYSRGVE